MDDVIVVGGGIGGLSAAIRAAGRGLSVRLLEAAPQLGGKAGSIEVDGVALDTGPSVLTLPAILDDVFRSGGTSLDEAVELLAHDHVFDYAWPDGTVLPVHFDPRDTVASVERVLGPEAAVDLSDFLAYAARIWDAAGPAFVLGEAPSLWSVWRHGLGALPAIDPLRRMWPVLRSRVRSAHLRTLLARYATYNGSDVRSAPATLHCIAHVELTMGCYGVRGGMAALVRALETTARDAGVSLHTGCPVEGIEVSDGRVTAVRVGGERLDARAVVVNADVRHLLADLLPTTPRALRGLAKPSMSGWTALIKARRRPRPPHAVLFAEPYLEEFAAIFDLDRPPEVPTVYVCAQARAHGHDGWAEHEPLFVMANAPPADDDTPESAWTRLGEATLARLRDAGWIEPDDTVVWTRSPTGLARRFPRTGGALYGDASNSALAAFRRPSNRVPGVTGLYLASGSAHPGGGVPLVARSGLLAADALCADLGLGAGAVP